MRLLVISLLTILAGTLLLAKFRKDMIGKVFVYISWFFIVVGFILFIGFIGGGICRLAHHGFPCQQNRCEMMMKGPGPGMHGRWCDPQCMDKGMRGPCCMSHDSTMKCCQKHMAGDSVKVIVPKK
jgi:hypothetical protein